MKLNHNVYRDAALGLIELPLVYQKAYHQLFYCPWHHYETPPKGELEELALLFMAEIVEEEE